MTVLEELQQTAAEVVGRAGASVVRIGRGWGRGAGVVIGDGTVVTNAHNLRGDETTVTFADGRSVTGHVRGIDVDGDLAVIGADTAGVPSLEWAEGDVALGTPVFALANPAGRGPRVTFGLVSAVGQAFRGPRGRRITGSLEHTAPLGRGSSGGPVVDRSGRLVGINTNRLGEGFYLAVPADADLRSRVDALGRGQSPNRRHLGLGLAPPRAARHMRRAVGLPEREGLLVRHVDPDGPAGRAGVRVGDLLVSANGRELASVDDLYEALDAIGDVDGGDADGLRLSVVRGTDDVDVVVTFGPTQEEGTA